MYVKRTKGEGFVLKRAEAYKGEGGGGRGGGAVKNRQILACSEGPLLGPE